MQNFCSKVECNEQSKKALKGLLQADLDVEMKSTEYETKYQKSSFSQKLPSRVMKPEGPDRLLDEIRHETPNLTGKSDLENE